MAKISALKPDDVVLAKKVSMPDDVIQVFNDEIARKFNGRYAHVLQKDVVAALVAKGYNRAEIFHMGWLDVEDIYRAEGWKVSYDKPGWNEFYDASFEFEKSK